MLFGKFVTVQSAPSIYCEVRKTKAEQPRPSLVTVTSQGTDDQDPSIPVFRLKWNSNGNIVYCQSGLTCDGSYGTHGQRSMGWYRMNVYLNYTKSTTYVWTKPDTDWVDTYDSSATSVRYRFRLKDTADPIIESVEIASVSPSGYKVLCKVSDDAGIANLRFGTCKDRGKTGGRFFCLDQQGQY